MIGTTISHYRIVGKLGEGGMGVVYLAEDILLGRRVAIKTLNARRGGEDQHFRARFLREARSVSSLSHPHIATVHDYGETEAGEPYIVMELIEGPTLSELIRKESLTLPRIITIIKQVAAALGEAHRQGIIHRDIKPSNVGTNKRGEVKVLDFGLAKQLDLSSISDPEGQTLLHTQTREGVIVGTPMYLSPEQALGMDIDARSDLFSLGALLYESIAGKPPFFGKSPVEICARVLRDDPPPPSQFNAQVPGILDQVTLKALAKKPEHRYQTAEEMIAALDEAQAKIDGNSNDRTVTRLLKSEAGTQHTGALATLSDIFKRPRLSIGYVAAGIIIAILIGIGWLWLKQPRLRPPTPEAQKLFNMGVASLQEGSYFKASKQFERAVAIEPDFALAHARLAESYAELDYADKAKDEMLIATRLIPNRSVLDPSNALYFDAISASVARDLPAAIKIYSQLANLKPNDFSSCLDLGRAYENHDELDKSIEQYAKAAALDSNNPAPSLRLAVLHGRRQDLVRAEAGFNKAESLYKDSLNFEGSSEVAYQRGVLLSQMSKIPEAQKAAEQSLNLATAAENPYQQVRANLLLSSIAYSSGKTDEAQELVMKGLGLARSNNMENLVTQGYIDLANSLLLSRKFTEAENYATQALTLSQTYREKRNEARANLLLGSSYMQQEKVDKAMSSIDRALPFFQAGGYRREVSRCMIMVGRSQLLKGDFDGALRTLDAQLELAKQVEDPGQLARSQAEVAAALSKQDMYPQALVRYSQSYELNKSLGNALNTAFALLNRGDMLARLGRFPEANTALDELSIFVDKLSRDNRYKVIWSAWSFLIRAQMLLSDGRFSEAKEKCNEALAVILRGREDLKSADIAVNSEVVVKGTLGLAAVLSGDVTNGLKWCNEAVRVAAAIAQQSTDDADVKLLLAEALLQGGDAKAALNVALQAQPALAARHREESEWRAWLLAALANQKQGNAPAVHEQVAQARSRLNDLQRRWGDAFSSYTSRADISKHVKLLQELESSY